MALKKKNHIGDMVGLEAYRFPIESDINLFSKSRNRQYICSWLSHEFYSQMVTTYKILCIYSSWAFKYDFKLCIHIFIIKLKRK